MIPFGKFFFNFEDRKIKNGSNNIILLSADVVLKLIYDPSFCFLLALKGLFYGFLLLLPRQHTYFCLASKMALLGFFITSLCENLVQTHISIICSSKKDLNSGPCYQLSYRNHGRLFKRFGQPKIKPF